MQQLRSSAQSKQRQILATRHLWESYLDDYRDFIMYMQTVILWRRPLDTLALYLCIHFILWHILGNSSFLGVVAVMGMLYVVTIWFLDTVQVRVPWRQFIPKVQKGHLAMSPRRMVAPSASMPQFHVISAAEDSASLMEKSLRRASRQLPVGAPAADSSGRVAATESLSSSVSAAALSTNEAAQNKTFAVRLQEGYSKFLSWYYSQLPPVRLKSYQDIVLRLVIIRFEIAQFLRAVQSVRRENPNKFTLRTLLILCGVALLGNALGTFLVVYFSTFAVLLAPPFLMYNMSSRSLKVMREALPTVWTRLRRMYSSRSQTSDSDPSAVPQETANVSLENDDNSDDSDSETAENDAEEAGPARLGPSPLKHWTDEIKDDRALLASSAPVGDILLRPYGPDSAQSELDHQSSLDETDGHRVLLPGRKINPMPIPAAVPPLELSSVSSSSLSTSPNDKKASPSNFIGLLKRNLSGALKQKTQPQPAPEPVKGHAALKKAQRRTVQLGTSMDDTQRPSKPSLETEMEELAASPTMLRPRRVTKRRRSGSIEPMMLVTSSDVASGRNRSGDDLSGGSELDRLRSVPSSPVLSPRLSDRDSDSMVPKVPKIPLVLLRGSRDDSVIQTPRHRP
eukprot:TRINITY_DN5666_c0_g1_i1.p1 TRINITY_DN5666_c0_g1~~TRINITY_DN5666_c0_g1_i1.p1  ORF type:complete len:624 (-),score=72.17 TRINITY_DN5666_c0_g1_i1:117-1988(-)